MIPHPPASAAQRQNSVLQPDKYSTQENSKTKRLPTRSDSPTQTYLCDSDAEGRHQSHRLEGDPRPPRHPNDHGLRSGYSKRSTTRISPGQAEDGLCSCRAPTSNHSRPASIQQRNRRYLPRPGRTETSTGDVSSPGLRPRRGAQASLPGQTPCKTPDSTLCFPGSIKKGTDRPVNPLKMNPQPLFTLIRDEPPILRWAASWKRMVEFPTRKSVVADSHYFTTTNMAGPLRIFI